MTRTPGFNKLVWGAPGHEREYILFLEEYDHDDFIPYWVERALGHSTLDRYGFYMMNRGSRFEIMPPREMLPMRPGDHEFVLGVVRAVLSDREISLQVN